MPKELCFRCVDSGKCELFDKWSNLVDLWAQANRKLGENIDNTTDETIEIEAIEARHKIA